MGRSLVGAEQERVSRVNIRTVNSIIILCGQNVTFFQLLQWNLSIKDTLNKGHLFNEDTVCSPNHIELCTNLPLN